MKFNKAFFILFTLIFAIFFPSCQNQSAADPSTDTVPESSFKEDDFSFSIIWSVGGSQTYDSKTGHLANDLHSTTLVLTKEEMNSVKKLIEDANINSFSDRYEGPKSKPAFKLNLKVTQNGVTKSIISNCSFTLNEGPMKDYVYDEAMLRYVSLCYEIIKIIGNTEEFQNLPKGKIYI